MTARNKNPVLYGIVDVIDFDVESLTDHQKKLVESWKSAREKIPEIKRTRIRELTLAQARDIQKGRIRIKFEDNMTPVKHTREPGWNWPRKFKYHVDIVSSSEFPNEVVTISVTDKPITNWEATKRYRCKYCHIHKIDKLGIMIHVEIHHSDKKTMK